MWILWSTLLIWRSPQIDYKHSYIIRRFVHMKYSHSKCMCLISTINLSLKFKFHIEWVAIILQNLLHHVLYHNILIYECFIGNEAHRKHKTFCLVVTYRSELRNFMLVYVLELYHTEYEKETEKNERVQLRRLMCKTNLYDFSKLGKNNEIQSVCLLTVW